MLEKVSIHNFRCFETLNLPLKQVNLVTGKNNVGKSALLEALFLLAAAHNPGATSTLNRLRRVGPIEVDPDRLWGWFFRNRNFEEPIFVRARENGGLRRELKVTLQRPDTFEVSKEEEKEFSENGDTGSTSGGIASNRQLTFQYKDSSGISFSVHGRVESANELEFESEQMVFPNSIFLGGQDLGVADVKRYSKLEEERNEKMIVEALKNIEPRLNRLAVSMAQGSPTIMGDLGDERLYPLWIMGEGVKRILRLAVGVADSKDGMAFIDEIENGIHHSALIDVWRSLYNISKTSNCQIVATTHSYECAKAAHQVFSEISDYPFALHRLDQKDGTVEAKSFDQEAIETSIKRDLEVR